MATTNNPFVNAPTPTAQGAPTGPDSFEVDLTDVGSQGLIPAGAYRARCVDVEQSVSKGGNPMFVWDFEVLEGAGKGRVMKVFTAITPAAMWKVAETVIALGIGQTGEVVKFKRSDVLDKECGVVVEDSEYNGSTRSQIRSVVSLKDLAALKAQ